VIVNKQEALYLKTDYEFKFRLIYYVLTGPSSRDVQCKF